jgi:hypothetical protein
MRIHTVALNTSGRNYALLDVPEGFTRTDISIYWGTTKRALDVDKGSKADGAQVRSLPVPKN